MIRFSIGPYAGVFNGEDFIMADGSDSNGRALGYALQQEAEVSYEMFEGYAPGLHEFALRALNKWNATIYENVLPAVAPAGHVN